MNTSFYKHREFEFVYARTPAELEPLRDYWQQLHQHQDFPTLESDIDYYNSVLASKEGTARPHIMLLRKHGSPIAMVVGRIEKHQVHCKLGYRTICKLPVSALIVVYGGIFGYLDETLIPILSEEFAKILGRREADLVYFQYLRTGTIDHCIAKTMPGLLCRSFLSKVEGHWRITVPRDLNEFFNRLSRNHRRNLRRKIRDLENAFPGQIRIMNYRSEQELAHGLPIAEEISKHTYQHALGVGLVNNPENLNILLTAARKGWLHMSILFVKDSACAFQWGIHYGNTLFLRELGYHPAWAKWNVGTVLLIKVLGDLCTDPSVQSLDWAFGDADYKRNYSDQHWLEESVYVFAARIYPIMVNCFKSAADALDLGLSWLVSKAGFYKKIKKFWRHRLKKQTPAEN